MAPQTRCGGPFASLYRAAWPRYCARISCHNIYAGEGFSNKRDCFTFASEVERAQPVRVLVLLVVRHVEERGAARRRAGHVAVGRVEGGRRAAHPHRVGPLVLQRVLAGDRRVAVRQLRLRAPQPGRVDRGPADERRREVRRRDGRHVAAAQVERRPGARRPDRSAGEARGAVRRVVVAVAREPRADAGRLAHEQPVVVVLAAEAAAVRPAQVHGHVALFHSRLVRALEPFALGPPGRLTGSTGGQSDGAHRRRRRGAVAGDDGRLGAGAGTVARVVESRVERLAAREADGRGALVPLHGRSGHLEPRFVPTVHCCTLKLGAERQTILAGRGRARDWAGAGSRGADKVPARATPSGAHRPGAGYSSRVPKSNIRVCISATRGTAGSMLNKHAPDENKGRFFELLAGLRGDAVEA